MDKLCECGCGRIIQEYDNRGRKRRFVLGHSNRGKVAVNKNCEICGRWICKNHKCPEKNWNSGEKNPMYGKKHSEKNKERWSKLKKGIPKSEEHKKKISLAWDYNKHITPEIILKMKNTKKGKCMGKDNPNYGNNWSDEQKKIASIRMTGKKNPKLSIINYKRYTEGKMIFPKKDTTIEIKIQDFLTLLHIEFLTHQYMHIEHGYQCDVFIPVQNGIAQKTIIECDGDYFHMNPNRFKPEDKCFKNGFTAKEKWKLDDDRTKELQEKGFRVIRLWEHKIRKMEVNDLGDKIYG
jgi:G:T-mismatch repair DNA endonuclease (very short patch repair protein)